MSMIFLTLAIFGGLIYLLIRLIKRSKRKMAEQKDPHGKIAEQQAIFEESLITTGYPPQNLPTSTVSYGKMFLQMLLLGIFTTPIFLFIIIAQVKSGITKQQNRVKEARIQRGITLSPEVYNASEAWFDKQRAEASKAILPAILVWIILVIVVFNILN